jgi:hypothetical protein
MALVRTLRASLVLDAVAVAGGCRKPLRNSCSIRSSISVGLSNPSSSGIQRLNSPPRRMEPPHRCSFGFHYRHHEHELAHKRRDAMSTETDFDDIYGSKYLNAADLRGEMPRRKIGKVEIAEMRDKDGTTKRKFVVFFAGEDKALPLNKTNAQRLAHAFTKDPRNWIGVTVELFSEMTSLGKEGVRLRPLKQAAVVTAPENKMDDEIPF